MKKSRKSSISKTGQLEALHVTFAEHTDQYVINSDSGIFLATDDITVDIPAALEPIPDRASKEVMKAVRPIMKLQKCVSIESQDNPFLIDGELRKKADYIINNSTISRKRIRIADPDLVGRDAAVRPQSFPSTIETHLTPESESVEIVTIYNPEMGVAYVSNDDVTLMDVHSSDSNKDQSSTEDVRSLTTSEHIGDTRAYHQEFNVDRSAGADGRHLLNSLPATHLDEEALVVDPLETSSTRPLLQDGVRVAESSAQQLSTTTHKLNGDGVRVQCKSNARPSPDKQQSSKSGVNSRVKKRKKCCLLQ